MPFHLDAGAPDMAFVYVQNPTGGVFAGDRLGSRVTAERGARVHLTTQSATKLYRMEDGGEAHQDVRIVVGEGAYVEHVPDPLIPQAGARYRQRTAIELARAPRASTRRRVAPGRRAGGERFAYELVELGTDGAARRAGAVRRRVPAGAAAARGPTAPACSATATTS